MKFPRPDTPGFVKESTTRINSEPVKNLRGSLARNGQPKKIERFVNHGLEESPEEARARFHSQLLDRVRNESAAVQPMTEGKRAHLLETIDIWEQSLWSSVDASSRREAPDA